MYHKFSASDQKQLQDLKGYIDEHLHLDIKLSSLCVKAGMNKHKLNAGFTLLYGFSVMGYVYQQRMQKADHLLRTSEKTIKQIAGESGYRYTSNFFSAYKKFFGRTAGSLRKG